MAKQTELEKVKERIMFLSQRTMDNGCTEHEAVTAMELMGKLLTQYGLTMEECDVRKSKCITVEIPVPLAKRSPMDSTIVELSKLFYGRCWWTPMAKWAGRPATYNFFIQEHDREPLEYFFLLIWNALHNEGVAFKKTDGYKKAENRPRALKSFQYGLAWRLSERLKQLRLESESAMYSKRSDGKGLIVLKGQLIDAEFDIFGPGRLRKGRTGHRKMDYQAYNKGYVQGSKVNMSRPVGDGNTIKGYLT